MMKRSCLAMALTTLSVACAATPHAEEKRPIPDASVHFMVDVPGLAPAPGAGYSYAAWSGRELVFFSGQVARDEHGALVGRGDFAAQAAQVFKNLRLALAAAGCSPSDVIKINYFIVGLTSDRLVAVRGLRDGLFPGDKPASTLVGVAALFDPDALLEIEVVAARAGK